MPWCHTVYPFVQTSLLAKSHCNESGIGLVQGLWLLLHNQYWVLTGTPLRFPAVALCHGDPAGQALSHTPEIDRWGRCWAEPPLPAWLRPGSGPAPDCSSQQGGMTTTHDYASFYWIPMLRPLGTPTYILTPRSMDSLIILSLSFVNKENHRK